MLHRLLFKVFDDFGVWVLFRLSWFEILFLRLLIRNSFQRTSLSSFLLLFYRQSLESCIKRHPSWLKLMKPNAVIFFFFMSRIWLIHSLINLIHLSLMHQWWWRLLLLPVGLRWRFLVVIALTAARVWRRLHSLRIAHPAYLATILLLARLN